MAYPKDGGREGAMETLLSGVNSDLNYTQSNATIQRRMYEPMYKQRRPISLVCDSNFRDQYHSLSVVCGPDLLGRLQLSLNT